MRKYLSNLMRNEAGEISIQGLVMMGLAMVFIAIGFIMFPIVTSSTDSILAYAYTANNTITDATFTGVTAVTGILPMVVLVGFLSAGVITGFLGVKSFKSGGGANLNPAHLMMLGISMIFIALGLIMFPITMDGVASVLHGGGEGISTSYTGLSSVLLVAPLIVLTGFMAGGIITGFFGVKGIAKGG